MKRISRRTFLRMASTLGVTAAQWVAAPYAVAPAQTQPQAPGVVRIVPLSRRQSDDAEMASYAIMGAQLGAEEANVTAGMSGTRVELIIKDATMPDNLLSLARQLTAQEHVSAITAALDDSATAELSAVCQQAGVVCLNTCAREGEPHGENASA
jgi:ABC-type branched-subunit amino acid transport system substrate-binding protein